jgi:FkbM family methyltransferase
MCVVDLGANRGRFSALLRERFPGAYHAVEANPALISHLDRANFTSIRNCAVTATDARATLRVAANDEGSSILPLPTESVYNATEVAKVEVDGMTLPNLLTLTVPTGAIDVMKVDIEGAEVAALAMLRSDDLRRIGQISVEFHSDPEFGFDIAAQTAAAMRLLRASGFVMLDFEIGHKDVLFLNRKLNGLSKGQARYYQAQAWTRRRLSPLRQMIVEYGRSHRRFDLLARRVLAAARAARRDSQE